MNGPEDEDAPRGAELWLGPFLSDPTLWPITAVGILIAWVLGGSALLLAREGNLLAALALVILFWISFDASLRQWRRGSRIVAACAAGFWLGSAGAAVAARLTGWF